MVKKRLLYWGFDAPWEEISHEVWNGVYFTITGEWSSSSVPLFVVPERNVSSYFSPSGVQAFSSSWSEESWSESIRYFIGISDWAVWFTPSKSDGFGGITSSSAEYGLVIHGQSGLFGSFAWWEEEFKIWRKISSKLVWTSSTVVAALSCASWFRLSQSQINIKIPTITTTISISTNVNPFFIDIKIKINC